MKAHATILWTSSLFLCGCELFTVGKGATYAPEIERSQRTAEGVVHLWKAEVDSGNVTAATELMRKSDGRQLLATERYELADDLQRWKQVLKGKPITTTETDTISASVQTVRIKVDYIRTVTFGTISVNNLWYVTSVK